MSSTFNIVYSQVPPSAIQYRICWNPEYPGVRTGIPMATGVRIRRAVKPETRERIKESVAREGIRNPILVYLSEHDMFLGFGGGRLQAAQELGLISIPAIVVDYTKKWIGLPVDVNNWREFYTDPPKTFEFTDFGIITHYGLEQGRREDFDEAGLAWATDDDMPAILKESPWLADGEK